jgi:hypothetical protein
MSFFVTSERPWQGRDLGRLAGADAHSQKLAAALLAAWTDCDRRRRDCLMRMVPGSLSVVVSADSLNHARQDGGKAHRRQHIIDSLVAKDKSLMRWRNLKER